MTQPNIPLPSECASGVKPDGSATATCYCGAVQLSFPIEGPDFLTSFVCNCRGCHKISASMFCTNFIVADKRLKHLRGEDRLTCFPQNETVETGSTMEDSFCSVCGILMYRRSSRLPGHSATRVGTVDEFSLHETKLRPHFEQYTRSRVGWLGDIGIEGIPHHVGKGI